jgi:hypothetical protein
MPLGGGLSHRPAEKPNRPVEVRERALPSQAIRRSIRQAVSVIGGGSTDRAEVAGLDQVEQALPTVSLRRLDRAVPAPEPSDGVDYDFCHIAAAAGRDRARLAS